MTLTLIASLPTGWTLVTAKFSGGKTATFWTMSKSTMIRR
jgi:hypothetical protein